MIKSAITATLFLLLIGVVLAIGTVMVHLEDRYGTRRVGIAASVILWLVVFILGLVP